MNEIIFVEIYWFEWMSRICIFGLSLIAGLVMFSEGLNRRMVSMRNKRYRKILTVAALSVSVGVFGYYGAWVAPISLSGAVLPLIVIGLAGLSDLLFRLRSPVVRIPADRMDGLPPSLVHPVTTLDLVTQYYRMELPNWSGAALRVVHLSDFHVSPLLPLEYFQQVVRRACEEKPDLIFITGDFVTFERDAVLLPHALADLKARLGIYAILGNHDHAKAAASVTRAVAPLGVQMIGGQVLRVPGAPKLLLAGDEHPWGDTAPLEDWAAAQGEALFVLTHTPDNFFRLASSSSRPSAVFAGHLHAGQLQLPYFGAVIVPSNYGKLFVHGHYRTNGTHLFVSSGIGAVTPPFRVWCQPEIMVIDINGI